jgi:DNA-binding CsgD family transcriptional regulator
MTLNALESILREVANATSGIVEMSVADRRKSVSSSICQLIDADVWLWFTGVVNQELNGDSMVTSFVDGGFENEPERAEFFRVIIHPELVAVVTKPLAEAMASQKIITCRRVQLLSDACWDESPVAMIWNHLGFSDFIISAFPVGKDCYSALGFHRRVRRPRFTEEDTRLVNILSHCLTWLHHAVPPPQATSHVLQLSPRERQVLMFLIDGDSRKQVASKLGISEHTVSDYLKAVYAKFSVNSRAELLSKFISTKLDA